MSIARQLFQLQEIELALEANEQAQTRIQALLKDNQEIVKTRARLTDEERKLEDLSKLQKASDWEMEDLTGKIKTTEKKLYDGKIHNSKELQALQQEQNDFKKNRSGLEDKALEMMDRADALRKVIAGLKSELAKMETQWQSQHQHLLAELEQDKTLHTALESQKQSLLPQIDAVSLAAYQDTRKRKGVAIAKIEQGICKGCRITLPNSILQQAKSGGLFRCSSCSRILYLP
jgi:predicted  nucleic acid-binding Zn-ribbon protein